MKSLNLGLFILVIIIAMACASTKTISGEQTSQRFEEVGNGILTGGGDEGIEESLLVVDSQSEFDNIKDKMNKVNYSTKALDDLSPDFKTESLIAYFQPVRSTGGYVLSADSLTKVTLNGAISYTLHLNLKSPQGAAVTMLTQPYIFVKTGKLKGPVSYQVREKNF